MVADLERFRADIEEWPAFPTSEYERRVQACRGAMVDLGIDVLVLFDPQSVCAFTGYASVNLWDPCAVVIPLTDPVRVLLWDFEVPRFEATGALGEVTTYAAHVDPAESLVRALRGVNASTYGCDDWTPHALPGLTAAIQAALDPSVRVDARRALWSSRLVKSPLELETLQESARITDLGVAAAADAVHVGATDREIAAAASAAMLRAGSGHFSIQPIVAVGPRAGVAHSESSTRAVRAGEAVFLELGASVHRYTAPVMRTVVAEGPDEPLLELSGLASRAAEAQVDAMRAGEPCSKVAKAASDIISEGGPDILFHGYFGYPVGVSFPPSWLENLDFHIHAGNHELLRDGMAFHLPLSLRHLGRRGVGLSYTVVVEAGGCRILTGTPAALIRR